MVKIKPGDIAISVIVVACALLLSFSVFGSRKSAAKAVIEVGGKVIASYPLKTDDDRIVTLVTDKVTFKVHLLHGKIAIVDIDCPDQICVRTGYIGKNGQSIICLPNRVSIKTIGDDDGEGVDIIAK